MPEGSVRIEKNKNLVAVDLGAGSCRIFSAKFNGSKIDTSEIYRFQNNAYLKNGTLFWDFANMMRQIKKGLDRISSGAEQLIDSIGVDEIGRAHV